MKFLNKSTYRGNLKIIMIDNAENLNLNSSNSLLKAIEEPNNNTFFFIIHNSSFKILNTIKSRCSEFKFTLPISKKKNVFRNIFNQYKEENMNDNLVDDFYFDTPGNLVKYFLTLDNANINITKDTLECIFYFINRYIYEKKPETLSFLSLFVEKFYNELCLNNSVNLSKYFLNLSQVLNLIYNMKRFNFDEKTPLFLITDTALTKINKIHLHLQINS